MSKVLYVSGRGGDHTKGLGGYISTLVSDYMGISVDVPFLRQELEEQINTIRSAITDCKGGTLIANSYGAYLTLLSLLDFEHELEQVILLSPVLGTAIAKDRMYFSRPPAAKRLKTAVSERRVNLPERSAIYIGDNDELYDQLLLKTYSDMMGEDKVFVLQGEKHSLSKAVMQDILRVRLELVG
jgi:alpha-beta hydrolase superfamily lysophospholipase